MIKQPLTLPEDKVVVWRESSSVIMQERPGSKKDQEQELNSILPYENMSSDAPAAAASFVAKRQQQRPKMVVFDKDGTLGDCTASLRRWVLHTVDCLRSVLIVNSEQEMEQLLVEFYDRVGWDVARNDVVPSAPVAAGSWNDIEVMVQHFLMDHQRNTHIPPDKMRDVVKAWNHELGDLHGQDAPVLEDLRGMLLACKKLGYLVAICTSDDRAGTHAAMKAWNIADGIVDVSICGDEVTHSKPSAVPIQTLCQRATKLVTSNNSAYLPHDCILVGDTTADTGMARAAGIGFCVGVLTGSGTTEQLLETGAHLILPDVGHVPALLQTFQRLSEKQEASQ